MEKREIIIIGGGPAGMAAALKLEEMAFRDVLLLEKEESCGGVLRQCIHPGFGLTKFGKNYTGPEYGRLYSDLLSKASVHIKFSSTVTEITPVEGGIKVVSQEPDGTKERLASAVILASGCREKSRGSLEIAGTRPSGIYTAGTAQALMNLKNLRVGSRVIIVGSGDIGLIMARRFTLEGSEVLAIIEKENVPGGLERNLRECVYDFQIPLLTGCQVVEIMGKKRVEAVKIKKADGSEEQIDCDTVIFAAGLVPENTMIKAYAPSLSPTGFCDKQQSAGQTRQSQARTQSAALTQPLPPVPGLFLCGNALYVHDLVDDVSASGEEAAIAAAGFVLGRSYHSPLAYESIEDTRAQRREYIAQRRKERERENNTQGVNQNNNAYVICTGCPNSCRISLKDFSGGRCEKGAAFAKAEITDPLRIFTSTIKTEGGSLISVRTDKPIPRSLLKKAAEETKKITVPGSAEPGTVICEAFLGTASKLITTS